MVVEFAFSDEVGQARASGRPIVALESTIITHGMPYPQNVETARLVEEDIRAAGATPATIAVLGGRLHVGLEPKNLSELGRTNGVSKLSRADIAVRLASGATGATTVAATMIAAHAVGISVFATGGIGGVHRGAEKSFDISADLHELAQTPVTVVAAGAKAILDLPKTFEVLETLGVPVIAYRQDTLPAFWTRTSEIVAPLRLDTPEAIAKAHMTRVALKLPGGQLICNPIPAADEIAAEQLAPAVNRALADADTQAIGSKELTPFVLDRIFQLTEGRSLAANISLVRNNARLASQIAVELRKFESCSTI
ncbi:MAG: pseudouridine-5'-phosphate glycosidase [Hyphomicrobiaceae bacterium]